MWLPSALLLLALSAAHGQVYGPLGCPHYQTSDLFTVDKVNEMIGSGGFIPYLTSGTYTERYQACQFFQLHDGGKFTYSYKDSSNDINTLSGSYDVVPSTFTTPGYLRLNTGRMGILGADITGNVRLHPVHIDEEKVVYLSCNNHGLFHEENAYTFLRPGARRSGDVGDIQLDLIEKGVPLAAEMSSRDQSCFETDPIMRQRVPEYLQNLRTRDNSDVVSAARRRGAEDLRINPLRDDDDQAQPRDNVLVYDH